MNMIFFLVDSTVKLIRFGSHSRISLYHIRLKKEIKN
jgi:hypothetical protein